MNSESGLLNEILTNKALDNFIHNSRCPETLNHLLTVKEQRIITGKSERQHVSIDVICKNGVEINLAQSILKKSLNITTDTNFYVSQVVSFFISQLHTNNSQDLYYALGLCSTLLKFLRNEKKVFVLSSQEVEGFEDGILVVLNKSSKDLHTLILVNIFPDYVHLCKNANFLQKTFELIEKTKKLEILCMCFDNFVTNSYDFNLLEIEGYWLLIKDCISRKSHLQRPAVYLLQKSIEIILTRLKLPLGLNFLIAKEKVWQMYFILLDVSNEKQLHLVQPSLILFDYIKNLHFMWRQVLYKLFLNHSQPSIVYSTAIFVLQNETIWHNYAKINLDLLTAINKNECNDESKTVFQEIGNYCRKLHIAEFESFLDESLKVSWIPCAAWCLFNNIFNDKTKFLISPATANKVIKKLKLLPHKFIRSGCIHILITCLINNYSLNSVDEVLKISTLIKNCDEGLLDLFARKIFNSEFCIDELYERVVSSENLQQLESILKCLTYLPNEFDPKIRGCNSKTDLIHTYLPKMSKESYAKNRIGRIEKGEDITYLLSLIEQLGSKLFIEEAVRILMQHDVKYNSNQEIVAYKVLSMNHDMNNKSIIFRWKDKILLSKEERMLEYFATVLLNQIKFGFPEEEIDYVEILDNLLDTQSRVVRKILENLEPILRLPTLKFIERCLGDFFKLHERGDCSKTITNKLLSQLFGADLIENEEFALVLLNFSKKLLDVSNSANSFAYVLSKNITWLTQKNPIRGIIFIPVIIDLILYGIIINKTGRVEYNVCKEIGVACQQKENPNVEGSLIQLCALESMLTLIHKVENQQDVSTKFVSSLIEKYKTHFNKRCFADSQIHLEKLRIIQTLVLLNPFINDRRELVNFITESFIQETHQPSVKHLMQWLLLLMVKDDSTYLLHNISEKLKSIDNNRPSSVTSLIPIYFHLMLFQEEAQWDTIVKILIPYTMGAQFKLRVYAQMALVKIYEEAQKQQKFQFLQKYDFLYCSWKQVIEATGNANYDLSNVRHDFLDYFDLKNCDFSTIFCLIPKKNGVTETEWHNLYEASTKETFKYVKFNPTDCILSEESRKQGQTIYSENIQRKITPWKEMMDERETANDFILITSLIQKSSNLGGLARTCEVFGIKKMVLRTSKITTDKDFKSLSMSSENWLEIAEVKVEGLQNFILRLKQEGFDIIGAEQTADSVKLDKFQFSKRTALLLGNEKEGISPDLIPLLDKCIEIPQFGMVRSLNVHVAGAVIMWEYCKQHKL